jgi:cyclophilin family peptidyl-prolyl cis-trans isomerase
MGDIVNEDGSGHLSHYDDNRYIKDEIVPSVNFCEAGIVAMANKGPNTNGSQFFITSDELPYLNDKYTIIGQTIAGYEKLQKLSTQCGSSEGKTDCDIKISKTGIYNFRDYMKDKQLKF